MIILSNTTDNLQIVLGGAITTNQLQCITSWRDVTSTTFVPDRTVTDTNNTTDVNIVPAPGATTQRVVDFISVYNRDTVNATVTIKLDANGTEYIMSVSTLSPGERLEYADGVGFRAIANNGAIKQTYSSGTSAFSGSTQQTILGADVTNNNGVANTIADVTGLSFPVNAGSMYHFKFTITFTSAATTTGSRWSINGPGSPTYLAYKTVNSLSTTAQTDGNNTAYDVPAASNASAIAAGNVVLMEGFIIPSSNGTVIARFASEVASSAIIAKAGSMVTYQQVI